MQKILIKQTDSTPQKFDSKKNNCGVIVKPLTNQIDTTPQKFYPKFKKLWGKQ